MNEPNPKNKRNHQSYFYVGSKRILEETDLDIGGFEVTRTEDIKEWINSRPEEINNCSITATFIVNESEKLVINGRHTEHVMCAKGKNVLAAGEIVFVVDDKEIYISEISNQSTGYCPKPESWTIVEFVLKKMGIDNPGYFTSAYEFRYCENCKNINLIKDDDYQCLVCGSELDEKWNFDKKID